MTISAQQAPNDQHCTASNPCVRICGNHVCAPGEVYPAASNQTKTQNSTTSGSSVPQKTMSQNATSGNNTLQNATYSSIPIVPKNMSQSTTGNNTVQNLQSTLPTPPKILSPRAQMASGIEPSHVKCEQGYGLILNLFDSRPACIKSDDITKFLSRGWGHIVT